MSFFTKTIVILFVAAAIGCSVVNSSTAITNLKDIAPPPEVKNDSASKGLQTAVLAGGCFWGVEAVFEHVKGVTDVKSGYSGGDAKSANYDQVSDGKTEHAESVTITFDPAIITYTQLLTVFFSVAHDPTQLNRQGPDTGTQYRSAIFYLDEEQKKLAQAYIEAIDKSKAFSKRVVTQVVPLNEFYEAEAYHQDFVKKNPTHAYVVYHDLPKLQTLKEKFTEMFDERK